MYILFETVYTAFTVCADTFSDGFCHIFTGHEVISDVIIRRSGRRNHPDPITKHHRGRAGVYLPDQPAWDY